MIWTILWLLLQFWSAYINCDDDVYVRTKMEQVDTILRMIEKYPEDFTLVTTAQGRVGLCTSNTGRVELSDGLYPISAKLIGVYD